MDFDELEDLEEELWHDPGTVTAARCAHERARSAVAWRPAAGAWTEAYGLFYGLRFPCNERTLKWLGPAWLTKAFRAAGTLDERAEVSGIACLRSLGARGAAERLLLELEYSPPRPWLHRKLLAKVPLDASERLKQLAKRQQAGLDAVGPLPKLRPEDYFAELNFYRLLEAEAPFRMPRYYYGDISDKTGKWILVTEWVPLPGEKDDTRSGELKKLFPDDVVATLNAAESTKDEQCFLVGPHGRCLAIGAQVSRAPCVTEERGALATWTLRRASASRRYLIAPNGAYLAVAGRGEQDLFLSFGVVPAGCTWEVVLAIGERHKCFFRSEYGTHLASLNDRHQTLFMSPNMDDSEKWRRVPVNPERGADITVEHLELRGADFGMCSQLVKAWAAFAGKQKAGRLGSPEFLEQCFPREAATAEGIWEQDAEWQGLRESAFTEEATLAQEFILRVGAVLFPEGTITPPTMKGYRAMLVTTRANWRLIRWWLLHHEDYVALGPQRVDMDSAFHWHQVLGGGLGGLGGSGLGLRDWEGASLGPIGAALWRWLSFADSDVLMHRRDDLLTEFAESYHLHGGPLLDLGHLRAHFVLAAALDSVSLLKAVPEIYRCWPKSEWSSIRGLRDTRLLGQTLGQGSLWLCLKSLVNIALVLSTCDIVEMLRQVTPVIFRAVIHFASPSEHLAVGAQGVDVRATCEASAPLVCRLPAGFPLLAAARRGRAGSEKKQERLVEVKLPVPGWVRADAVLRPPGLGEEGAAGGDFAALSGVLERMFHTRRQYTGNSPLGMSAISSIKLCDTLVMYEHMFRILERFGHGGCQVTHGAFKVQERPRGWWPQGYEDWAHHSFLLFDDGTIADITADQFDDVPQLWWPADRTRYALNDAKADVAEAARRVVGVQRWTELLETDAGIPAAMKRHRWWAQELREVLGAGRLGSTAGPRGLPRGGDAALDGPAVLSRHGQPLQLPPISKEVDMGPGRHPAAFRRITTAEELEIWLVDELFKLDELQVLVQLCQARGGFQRSLQTSEKGQQVQDGRRTSTSCAVHWPLMFGGSLEELRHRDLPVQVLAELEAAQQVTEICARVLAVEAAHIEPLQLVKYVPGQFYRAHLDTHKEPDRLSSHMGEQRTHTLLVFLADIPADDGGGHLHFPRLGLRVLPRAGSAVLWRNLKEDGGRVDRDSLHEGEPPLRSEKVAMNVWVSDRPFTKELVDAGKQRRLRQALASAPAARLGGPSVPGDSRV